MEKITEFRNTLAVPIHKLSIDSLVQEVCLCPEYFEDIYFKILGAEAYLLYQRVYR